VRRPSSSSHDGAGPVAAASSGSDAGIYRVLGQIAIEPVTREIGDQAGKLIGAADLHTSQAVDAVVASTALTQTGPTLIVTADVPLAGSQRPA
jgi:hypothetical protein